MGRILIDTDELRRLSTTFESGAAGIGRLDDHLVSGLSAVSLNTADPGIRSARVHERQTGIHADLRRVVDEYGRDAHEFRALASRLEASERSGGAFAWLEPIDIGSWVLGLGFPAALLGAAGLAGVVGHAIGAGALDSLRAAGLNALQRTQSIIQSGQSILDSGLGLLADAAGGFSRAADWVGDRIRRLVVGAWSAIWGSVTELFASVMQWMQNVVSAATSLLSDPAEIFRSVGRWPQAWLEFQWAQFQFVDNFLKGVAGVSPGSLLEIVGTGLTTLPLAAWELVQGNWTMFNAHMDTFRAGVQAVFDSSFLGPVSLGFLIDVTGVTIGMGIVAGIRVGTGRTDLLAGDLASWQDEVSSEVDDLVDHSIGRVTNVIDDLGDVFDAAPPWN